MLRVKYAQGMNKVDKSGRYETQNLPKWFADKIGTFVPMASKEPKKKATEQHMTNNILCLLHQHGPSVDAPTVHNLHQLFPGAVTPTTTFKLKFVKVKFASIQEARNRAVYLALLTCNYLKGVDNYVKLHSVEEL